VKDVIVVTDSAKEQQRDQSQTKQVAVWGIVVSACALVLSILVSLAPLRRLVGVPELTWPTYKFLIAAGVWLPTNLHFSNDGHASQLSTHIILLLSCMALAFMIYLGGAGLLQRQSAQGDYQKVMRVIWLTTLVIGLIYVFTPAMLSHDIFVYTAYGRILTVYHANPYFTTLANFPHDPFFRLDDWKDAPAAYGPVWIAVCALGSLLIGDSPDRALLVYRFFGLGAHLLNTLLVMHILRTMERSPRTVTLGTLLYAWNPLVLEESSLGAHNDTFMFTLILLGILFSVRTERQSTTYPPGLRSYLPSLLALTLATLVKFTAAPMLALYLILLAGKAFSAKSFAQKPALLLRLRAVLITVIPAALISGAFVVLLYLPYWFGLSISGIIYSFTSPPSANSSDNSILFAIIQWNHEHGLPPTSSWSYPFFYIFALHQTWNYINTATLVCMLLVSAIWIWRSPTTRTMILASLAILGATLIVTFWFFPWYVIWLIALMAICLPISGERVGRALVAFALAFSASAFCIYLFFNPYSSIGSWIGWTCLTTVGPPLIALLVWLTLPIHQSIKN